MKGLCHSSKSDDNTGQVGQGNSVIPQGVVTGIGVDTLHKGQFLETDMVIDKEVSLSLSFFLKSTHTKD